VVTGVWLCRFQNRHVCFLNNIIHPGFSELHYLLCSGILSNNFVILIQAAVILETRPNGNRHVAVLVLELAGMLFKQYYSSRIPRITLITMFWHSILSINFVIFIQAAVILKTGPGGNWHVAVPVPGPASTIFQQPHPPGIPRITLFMMFQHSLYQYCYFYSSCRNS
jgi:hypothetical protein